MRQSDHVSCLDKGIEIGYQHMITSLMMQVFLPPFVLRTYCCHYITCRDYFVSPLYELIQNKITCQHEAYILPYEISTDILKKRHYHLKSPQIYLKKANAYVTFECTVCHKGLDSHILASAKTTAHASSWTQQKFKAYT